MGIKKKPNGREVWVYNPAVGRMVYVGTRKLERDARSLFREKTDEFAGAQPAGEMTCDEYADRWLTVKHGPGTRRPAAGTLQVNRDLLTRFREDFGDHKVRGGITRVEALDWCRKYPTRAKAVSAMFNDAIDDMLADANPFGNRRLPEGRGRKDIAPLTEAEVAKLAELATGAWGAYGVVVGAWITFLGWVGARPSETFSATWERTDVRAGRVTVDRVKGAKETETIVLPEAAGAALLAMPGPRRGLLFLTPQGKPYDKGAWGYYWRPVRAAFRAWLADADADRLPELDAAKGTLDPYALRHFCGSLMADRGLTEFDISHQLGNSPEVCRKTYIHTHRDRANDRVAAALNGSVVDLASRRKLA